MQKLSVEEFKARHLAVLAEERAHFRENWPWIVLGFLCEVGGGFVFGVALAAALFIWALDTVSRVS